MPFIDTMIVTSHFVGEQLRIYSGRDSRVIHPVLDKIPQQSNKSIISENDSRVLLFTHGRLEPGKGIETVISVWKSLEADEETQ
jgi:glycosyltransferase involved in cell wall biosynthesis